MLKNARLFIKALVWDERNRFSDPLRSRVAKGPLDRLIPGRDRAFEALANYGVFGGCNDGSQRRCRILSGLQRSHALVGLQGIFFWVS